MFLAICNKNLELTHKTINGRKGIINGITWYIHVTTYFIATKMNKLQLFTTWTVFMKGAEDFQKSNKIVIVSVTEVYIQFNAIHISIYIYNFMYIQHICIVIPARIPSDTKIHRCSCLSYKMVQYLHITYAYSLNNLQLIYNAKYNVNAMEMVVRLYH